ncbi:Potassium voltage-gated channel subfamily F member 1 [Stylophora pistillata]|uniref:Potassium voltage-gated channel subfamily F member 1 n=1 Tax=Stylophora pistillata TaxID=50429 RepID=A0A2B4SVD3_STYPI|nr:Potassium voltage-gated channel subfamily F member 1 [Stylophora pistillata]
MGEEVVLKFFTRCGATFLQDRHASSEFEMISLLRHNKIHVAAPIFEPTSHRHYSEFYFIQTHDYPGTVYISIENREDVVLNAVLSAWPLFGINLVLAAIAGIFVWALDTYWNPEEFNRPFLKGSWDGFWWSFISMTTVGYGDKVPKSARARIFSVIWITLGLISMSIFTAHIASTLTALSMEHELSLKELKIAVLDNGTEYQHALEEDAIPTVFGDIDGAIQALEAREVNGIMLDRLTASFYQKQDKLKSLVTVKTMDLQREVGFLVSKRRKFFAECLEYFRPDIYQFGLSLTQSFKLKLQNPEKTASVFGDQFTKLKLVLYISLGVLSALILMGILWECFRSKKAQQKVKRNQGDHYIKHIVIQADSF